MSKTSLLICIISCLNYFPSWSQENKVSTSEVIQKKELSEIRINQSFEVDNDATENNFDKANLDKIKYSKKITSGKRRVQTNNDSSKRLTREEEIKKIEEYINSGECKINTLKNSENSFDEEIKFRQLELDKNKTKLDSLKRLLR